MKLKIPFRNMHMVVRMFKEAFIYIIKLAMNTSAYLLFSLFDHQQIVGSNDFEA